MIETIAIAGITSAIVSLTIVAGAMMWAKNKVKEMTMGMMG